MSLPIKKWLLYFLLTLQLQIFWFFRPSDNPIDAEGFKKIIDGDVVQEKEEITKNHLFYS